MVVVIKPAVNSYGNSFGHPYGSNISEVITRGEVDRDKLNKVENAEEAELTSFEKLIKNHVLAGLGHPVVKVELHDFNIKTAVHTAITRLSYYAPQWLTQHVVFQATAGCNV